MKRSSSLVLSLLALGFLSASASALSLASLRQVGTDPGGGSVRLVYGQAAHQNPYEYTWYQNKWENPSVPSGAIRLGPVYCRTTAPYPIYWRDPIFDTLLAYLRQRYPAPQWSWGRGSRGSRGVLTMTTLGRIPFDINSTDPNATETPGSGIQFGLDHTRQIGTYTREESITFERLYTRGTAPNGTTTFGLALQWVINDPFVTWGGARNAPGFFGPPYQYPDSTAIYPKCGNGYGRSGATQYTIVDDIFPVTHSYDQYGNHGVTIHGGIRIQNVSKRYSYEPWPATYPELAYLF